MNKNFNKIYPFIFSISIIIIAVFVAFYTSCFFDKDMLMKLWNKYNTMSELPFKLSTEDLYKIQYELMDYLKLKVPFLETKVTIDGVLSDFYSIRTKIHMADVRVLFKYSIFMCFIAMAFAIFSLFKIKNLDKPFKQIHNAYKKTLIVFIVIFSILIAFASINFDAFFIRFHQLLFTNDFWLLNPREDYIICLLPEKIFMEIGEKIVILIIIILTLFGLLCRILSKIQQNLEAK